MMPNILTNETVHTAEMVGRGHPDKACDQIGDAVLDELLRLTRAAGDDPRQVRTAIEIMAKGHQVILGGEIRAGQDVLAALDLENLVRACWTEIGYADAERVDVLDLLAPQAPEIARMIDDGGAGDQGIMLGAAFRDTPEGVPLEYALARRLILALDRGRADGPLDYLGTDAKSQVSVRGDGRITSVIISTQHAERIPLETLRGELLERIVLPELGDLDPDLVKINHKGSFVEGGTIADAGVLGRKIVVDALGPRVPVGGGAFSGKDPTKVDRSAAYQARQIAREALEGGAVDAASVTVALAYGIGQLQPEMVKAVTDSGDDLSAWVRDRFPDLSPAAIQERLGLWHPKGWSYAETARAGHYGHASFPWESAHADA